MSTIEEYAARVEEYKMQMEVMKIKMEAYTAEVLNAGVNAHWIAIWKWEFEAEEVGGTAWVAYQNAKMLGANHNDAREIYNEVTRGET